MNSFEEVMVDQRDATIQRQGARIRHMDGVINSLREELENIKMVASVSEDTKQEAVNDLKRRHQDEIESLRRALEESFKNSEIELREQFDRERQKQLEDIPNIAEVSMEQAQSEAEKLKSVVLPLEEEIKELKSEIAVKNKQLELEKFRTASSVDSEETSELNEETIINETENKNCEEENKYLKEQLKKVLRHLKREKCEHDVLKLSWNSANDQFLESHRLLQRDVSLMESVLLDEQKEKVKSLKLREQAKEAQINPLSAKSPTTSLVLLRQKTEEYKELASKELNSSTMDDDCESFGSFQDFHRADSITSNSIQESKPLTLQMSTNTEVSQEDDVKSRKELEESIMQASDEGMKRMRELADKLADYEVFLRKIEHQQMEINQQNNDKLNSLVQDNVRLKSEINYIISERDKFRQMHEKHQSALVKEAFVMPKTPEAVKSQINMYREAMATSKSQHEITMSKLQAKISFLENRLKSEENLRVQVEKTLGDDLQDTRRQSNQLQNKLLQLQKDRDQYKVQLEKEQLSLDAVRSRSKEIIEELRNNLAKETKMRETLEKQLSENRNKLHSLQESLETSEQVQRDFVRLSQQLQMQLEQVRLREEAEETKRRASEQADVEKEPTRSPEQTS